MSSRVRYIATCVLVIRCDNIGHCLSAEKHLLERGFHSRSSSGAAGRCMRSLEREFASGEATGLLDGICRDVERAVARDVTEWKAFVQVCGSQSAWATLEAGKPTRRGKLTNDSRQ